ncbi:MULTISPECIES: hypothetical protein [Rhizobium/Agrobacterium group]|uniref:hypothetical protein n=1 Tax=Rhizobium/Agrobacterium group TaxID=227290 RepID=UPI000B3F6975|nr:MULTISPECIES: hypothetical protein [Rhizobium/Agrobacterium group]MCF1484521.1 hypothetical protein [Allorhizobium ampelinum]NSZ43170.1 hypothetical protein [Agrobacterium vitis]NTA26827.1 hypothetical protein [Allorhizobium ampelinum]OVE94654.1 hypothetical protein B7W85_10015 [Allorhizobium ampelinum]
MELRSYRSWVFCGVLLLYAWSCSAQTTDDCAVLKNSHVPFILTIQADAVFAEKGTETLPFAPARLEKRRVVRDESDIITQTLLPQTDKDVPIVSKRHFWRGIESSGPDGTTVFQHEVPLPDDPVARRENFSEIYTRIVNGKPGLKLWLDAVYLGSGTYNIGSCSFQVHRYRITRFTDHSPNAEAVSTSIETLAPELMVPLSSETEYKLPGETVTQVRRAIAIDKE